MADAAGQPCSPACSSVLSYYCTLAQQARRTQRLLAPRLRVVVLIAAAGHHAHELLVVDLAVAVNIGLTNHLVDLLLRQLLPEVRHDVAQLRNSNVQV